MDLPAGANDGHLDFEVNYLFCESSKVAVKIAALKH